MVIARQHNHTAVAAGTGRVRMFEHIAATIDAGAFAVPHREHAIDIGVLGKVNLLAAPDTGRGQVFIQTRLKNDPIRIKLLFSLPQRLIEPTQW